MLTDKQKVIISVLNEYGTCTANDIVRLAKKDKSFTEPFSANSATGILRSWITKGLAANADNGYNKKVYWLTDYGKEFFKKQNG